MWVSAIELHLENLIKQGLVISLWRLCDQWGGRKYLIPTISRTYSDHLILFAPSTLEPIFAFLVKLFQN